MNKYIVLLLILLTGFTATDVRRETIFLDWHKTVHPGNRLGYTFTEASYSASLVPCFYKSFALEGPGQDMRFILQNPVFEEIEPRDTAYSTEELPGSAEIEKTVLRSGQDEYIEIRIPAVISNDGKIFLLKEFELQQVPVRTKSAEISQNEWKSASILKEGRWVKISTSGKGIYIIPWSKLSDWGFSNPSQVRVFGAGGMILPEDPGISAYDDLPGLSVWHGKNKGTDCLFFFAPGTTEWKAGSSGFTHHRHPYTTTGHFFLTDNSGSPRNITELPEEETTPTHTITSFDDFLRIESELYNLLHSGKQWFGDKFIQGTIRDYLLDVPDAAPGTDLTFLIRAASRTSAHSEMVVAANQSTLGKINFATVNTADNTGIYADEQTAQFTFPAGQEKTTLSLRYAANGPNPEAWLDFIELHFRRQLKMQNNNTLFFRDKLSAGSGNIVEFIIDQPVAGLKVWDVTDPFNVQEVPLQFSDNQATGRRPASVLREYAAFHPDGSFPEPELVGEVANQNLHGMETPEYLIVTSPAFMEQAGELAQFHRMRDGLQTAVVSSAVVYNEFSSGNKDATGIRNFIKMLYDRNEGLKYVLLFGDGSYDNRNIHPESNTFIPTYQSDVSLDPVGSFVSDDYFVLLDPGESVYNGAVDLGIGRIPASTIFQADLMVRKIKNYHAPEALGEWRNVVSFIADDEDNNLHMFDSERLADQVKENHSELFMDKIYLDAYNQISGPGGESYPEVTEAINQRVKDGVLVLNYVGHANDRYLAHENVLNVSHINSWSNANTLPVFVTATCEFSRFDADDISAGEYILFNPNGGGIGLFSTTRLVFAYSNYLLSRSFYRFVFGRDANGDRYRMGDIMRLAKINTINTINKRNFTLLTDPALKLSLPENKVITSSINGHDPTGAPDTLGALQKVTISGFIADQSGQKMNDFNGTLIPLVLDKAVMMKTKGNANETPMEFNVQENVIYKGTAEVTHGEFTFSFVIPKDISYQAGQAKIIYYAENGSEDAHGSFENLRIGGSGTSTTDNQGPDMELFMDTREFVNGGTVSRNPVLLADLYDENGINTVGSGIGHDITAVLDDDYAHVMILNNYYRSDEGDYTSGTIRYPLKNLPEGEHTLKLKVWDVANNSTEKTISFKVTEDFLITHVKNYPNPVYDHTFFTFEHNQADAVLETIFEVFDQNGRRIDYFSEMVGSDGTISNPVRWDLKASNILLRNGIYIYRITARNNDGIITTAAGKLIVAR